MYRLMLIGCLGISVIRGDFRCISNRDGKKVTAYHYVTCPCDCSKYRHSSIRRQCAHCKHFHGNRETPLVARDAYSLNLPALDAAFASKTE